MTRLLSMAGLICMPFVQACGEAKTLSNFAAVIPTTPAAAALRKSLRFCVRFVGIVQSFL
jgi:hypothetical protein